MTVPPTYHPPAPSFEAAPQQSPMVFVSASPRPLPRLRPTGWFSNAYGTTMGVILALMTIPAVLCGGLLLVGGAASTMNPPVKAKRQPTSKVTATNFAKVRVGMKSTEVLKLLGDNASVLSEIEIGDIRVITLQWEGSRGSCNVTFEDGRVASKVQFGLP